MQPSSLMATQTGRMPRERRLAFRNKKNGLCHREAVERSITLHATTKDVGEHISSAHDEDKANNRKCLINCHLTSASSNFTHIFHLRTEDNPARSTWLVKKTNEYAWQMQHGMLTFTALEVLRDVAASLQCSPLYSI